MSPWWFAVVVGVALIVYAVTAGADYGAGVWDLLARKPSRPDVRKHIEHALGPIWEANHVWLIFIVVTMFTVFPKAFSVIVTALHIPLTLALIGMVVRGAAFVFRAYGMDTQAHRRGWGIAFGAASVGTPIALGMCLAGLSSGAINVENGVVVSGFLAGWWSVFGVVTGVFALCLFLFLSAVYLCWDAGDDEREVRAWFRQRALVMQGVGFVAAAAVAVAAALQAPLLFAQLWSASWALPAQGLVFLLAVAVTMCLVTHRYRLARLLAPLQVAVIVAGFGLALDGHLVVPDIGIDDAGARDVVMEPLLPVLVAGMLLVLPSLWLLFRLFKRRA